MCEYIYKSHARFKHTYEYTWRVQHTHTHTPTRTYTERKATIRARSVVDDGSRVFFNGEIPRRHLRIPRIRELNARGAK